MKVILDRDLAKLYGVTAGNLNKDVKRSSVLHSPIAIQVSINIKRKSCADASSENRLQDPERG